MASAAFFGIDVTVVRVVFVILTFATFGAWILAYLIMSIVIRTLTTPEDRAAAYGLRSESARAARSGQPASCERAARVAAHVATTATRLAAKLARAAAQTLGPTLEQRNGRPAHAAMAEACPDGTFRAGHAGISLPVFAIVNAAMFVAWILVMISAAMTWQRFSAGRCRQICRFGARCSSCSRSNVVLTAPLRAGRHHGRTCVGPYYGPWAALSGLFWLGFTVLFFWLAYQHIPQVHALLDQLPALWQKRQILFCRLRSSFTGALSLMSPGGFFRTNALPFRNPNEAPWYDEFQSDHTSVTAQTFTSTKPSGSARSRITSSVSSWVLG